MTEPSNPPTQADQDLEQRPSRPLARPLWVRLLVAFALVAVVAVGVVAILANRTTAQQFQSYISQGRQARAEALAPELADYYLDHGGWDGVQAWLTEQATLLNQGMGVGQGRGRGRSPEMNRLVLTDPRGLVLADSQGNLLGERFSSADLTWGAPIQVDGQTVGILLLPTMMPSITSVHESLESQFLNQVNRSILIAGLIAGAVALILGLLLARQLTAPLRSLTLAAQQLANGQVPQVPARSGDEIGELAHAFNQMARSLAHQETLRRNLMADIAHELRTPLTVMRGDLEALLDGVYEPTPGALASLQEEALLLTRLVDDLRALAQAEAGQLQLSLQPTNLEDLLRSVIDAFDLQAESQGQILNLDIPQPLPTVDADAQRVRQVFANLISNALRHAPQSGHVLISATVENSEVRISVSDSGPGIPADDLPFIFDRFWRGHQTRSGGSGLGLTIARELVRAHGGRIWVESEPGAGTTFSVTLPLHR